MADARTVGFHLSDNTVTIDLEIASLTAQQIDQAEAIANHVVWQDRAVTVRFVTEKDAQSLPLRRLPEIDGDSYRLIDIEDFDLTACGGTHVARTGAVGMVKIVRRERRGEQTRVEFMCGERALLDYRTKNEVVMQLASAFTTSYTEVDSAVDSLRDQVKEANRKLKRQQSELMSLVAHKLASDAICRDGVRIVTQVFNDRDPGQLRQLARQLTDEHGAVALLGLAGDKAQLIFARPGDGPGSMNELLQETLPRLGDASGGGSPHFAQGGGPAAGQPAVESALAYARDRLLAQLE